MVGDLPYLALVDPGATILLVGPRLLNKYCERLRLLIGYVKGVSGALMKIRDNFRISIDVDGSLGLLEFRAVSEINHDILLGNDFGFEWDLIVRFQAKQWKFGDQGEWHSFATSSKDSTSAIMAECAGLTEMIPTEPEKIKEILDRLIGKPATSYLPTTYFTEHHINLSDYTRRFFTIPGDHRRHVAGGAEGHAENTRS